MIRETGFVYGHPKITGAIGGQIVVSKPTRRGGNGSFEDRWVRIPQYKDVGCKHSPSCLGCKLADMCTDCTEPLTSCAVCKVLLECPMFGERYAGRPKEEGALNESKSCAES
jgi:hypothetical protein